MALALFEDRGTPLDQQRFTWRELAGKPISKLDDDAFTRVRIILMNGIEMEALRFQHPSQTGRCLGIVVTVDGEVEMESLAGDPHQLAARSPEKTGRRQTPKHVKPAAPGRVQRTIIHAKGLLKMQKVDVVSQLAEGVGHVPHPGARTGGAGMGRDRCDQQDLSGCRALTGIQSGPSGG